MRYRGRLPLRLSLASRGRQGRLPQVVSRSPTGSRRRRAVGVGVSQENIEIAMRANAAFNSRDLDSGLQFFSSDAELRDLANAPDQGGAVKGIDAIREAWTLWTAAFDELRADVDEWTDVGDAVIGAG